MDIFGRTKPTFSITMKYGGWSPGEVQEPSYLVESMVEIMPVYQISLGRDKVSKQHAISIAYWKGKTKNALGCQLTQGKGGCIETAMKTTEKLNIHLQVEALAFLLSADLYLQQECPLSYGTS